MNNKVINSEIAVAYSQCLRKAFLLLCTDEQGTIQDCIRIIEERKIKNRIKYIDALQKDDSKTIDYNIIGFNNSDLLVKAILKNEDLEAYCDILTKNKQISMYEPTLIVGTHSFTKDQKIELCFIGFVLGEIQGCKPNYGTIILMGGQIYRAKLTSSYQFIDSLLGTLREWLEEEPPVPPVILNQHCSSCQYRALCKAKAQQDDNLSLLNRMTPKAIHQYNKKGIFTVFQLSYLFKPRRNKKNKKNSGISVQHKLELQALAIREQKIYLQDVLELTRSSSELFLDIEGIPEQNFYYLLGLLVCDGSNSSYYCFWADTPEEQEEIWNQLLSMLNKYPEAKIYHYGSYEPNAVAQLAQKYSTDCQVIKKRLININSYIYGRVYFPTFSNSLKDIGHFIGACWTYPEASGLQSITWRYQWEDTQNNDYKRRLITYNEEDCRILKQLTDELTILQTNTNDNPQVRFATQSNQYSNKSSKQIHQEFEIIIKSAHADYDKNKISLKTIEIEDRFNDSNKKEHRHQTYRKILPKARESAEVPQRTICPKHLQPLEASKKIINRTAIDLIFTKDGIRKAFINYWGVRGYCPECRCYYNPTKIDKFSRFQVYGYGFQAWVAYQRVALRLPHRTITKAIEEQFNEVINSSTIRAFVKYVANAHIETHNLLINRLLESPFIHVDETQINIQGVNWYVWVFTDSKHVIFKLTKTREAKLVHEILSNYKGILISDFYAGYDSVNCKQQKCWIHLIRDLNDALWKYPFDNEFELFILQIRNLILPIFQSIEEHGLKKKTLVRFLANVNQFYRFVIDNRIYSSELVNLYQKRFIRYRESLFTFLEEDGIPWHNNTAENAIRHVAKQREISGAFFESSTRDYLLLLGVYKSCQFQDKSFLKFLLSEEKNIDKFKSPKCPKNTIPVGLPKN